MSAPGDIPGVGGMPRVDDEARRRSTARREGAVGDVPPPGRMTRRVAMVRAQARRIRRIVPARCAGKSGRESARLDQAGRGGWKMDGPRSTGAARGPSPLRSRGAGGVGVRRSEVAAQPSPPGGAAGLAESGAAGLPEQKAPEHGAGRGAGVGAESSAMARPPAAASTSRRPGRRPWAAGPSAACRAEQPARASPGASSHAVSSAASAASRGRASGCRDGCVILTIDRAIVTTARRRPRRSSRARGDRRRETRAARAYHGPSGTVKEARERSPRGGRRGPPRILDSPSDVTYHGAHPGTAAPGRVVGVRCDSGCEAGDVPAGASRAHLCPCSCSCPA